MPALQVREVPAELYNALKREAQQEKRSLARQTLVVLARGLAMKGDDRDRRQALLASMRAAPLLPAGKRPLPVVRYVREDRTR